MVREVIKSLLPFFNTEEFTFHEKAHMVEVVGKMEIEGEVRDVICDLQIKRYIPRDVYGEAGYPYESTRKRKVKRDGQWIYIEEPITRYEMSEADKKFVYVSYVYHHLDARQMTLLSGIPEPYIFRYIKHMKLKPKYGKIPRSEKAIKMSLEETGIDFNKAFHLDPFPTRSEWKVRREELGLKNGENWRNKPYDENPGEKIYGDGSKSARKKAAKLERREKRRRKNIQKFNLHQNNRYGMTTENPEGNVPVTDYHKKIREDIARRKRKDDNNEDN